MASSVSTAVKKVKPLLSSSSTDARRRVLGLYKTWCRHIPNIVAEYDIPKREADCKMKLREEFLRNAHVTDIRVIDLLVIKGQMELQETINIWKTKASLMNYFKDTWEPKPKDFMSKFFSGQD